MSTPTPQTVTCHTPTKGKDGTTTIPRWKYDAVSKAILEAIGTDGLAFRDLSATVGKHLSNDELSRLGSLGWHVTTVKLDMEYRGQIMRIEGRKPQYLMRC